MQVCVPIGVVSRFSDHAGRERERERKRNKTLNDIVIN